MKRQRILAALMVLVLLVPILAVSAPPSVLLVWTSLSWRSRP